MAQHILFVTSQYVKDNTAINDNVDSDILEPYIVIAQKVHIERILGTDLYQKLQADIVAGSVTGVYKVLLDEYVQNVLAQYSFYESLPFLNYKMTNKSVLTKDSDNSTAAGIEEIRYLQGKVRDICEYLAQRIHDYLCANSTDYPEYTANNDSDDIKPSNSSYFGGLYLGE